MGIPPSASVGSYSLGMRFESCGRPSVSQSAGILIGSAGWRSISVRGVAEGASPTVSLGSPAPLKSSHLPPPPPPPQILVQRYYQISQTVAILRLNNLLSGEFIQILGSFLFCLLRLPHHRSHLLYHLLHLFLHRDWCSGINELSHCNPPSCSLQPT